MRTGLNGTLTREGEHATITFERRLPFDIETVWAAITDPEKRAKWFGPTVIDAREGGMIETIAEGPPAPKEHRRVTGRILVWKPPHVFEHEANQSIVGATIVRYELHQDGDDTILRLTHRLLSPSNAAGYIPGTHAFLDRLEAYLEGAELPNWVKRYGEVERAYAEALPNYASLHRSYALKGNGCKTARAGHG